MGVTEQRMEQLGITLQQTDWRGKGAVEAVLAGDMLYISAHYPVDENGTPVYVGRVGAEIDEAAAYQAAPIGLLQGNAQLFHTLFRNTHGSQFLLDLLHTGGQRFAHGFDLCRRDHQRVE